MRKETNSPERELRTFRIYFFIPQTTINRNRNGVKTWREIIGIWILRIERRSRRGTPAGIARLKSPRGLACIPRRSTTNCNEAIPEKWTRHNAKFTARSGRKRWFGKTSSVEAAAGRHRQTAGAEREVLTVTNFEKLAQSPRGVWGVPSGVADFRRAVGRRISQTVLPEMPFYGLHILSA